MTGYDIPIPELPFPEGEVPLVPVHEPLVRIRDAGGKIILDMRYRRQNVSGAIDEGYLRKTALEKLLAAAAALPENFRLKIYDAWRPLAVQKALYDQFYRQLRQEGGYSPDELKKKVLSFVSYPSDDPGSPPVHCTGGAVDLTIADERGRELDMGGGFDELGERSATAYYEKSPEHEIRRNRRLLYHVMTSAGFVNLPSEWWHYDYGTRFWGLFNKTAAKYTGIFETGGISEMRSGAIR